MCPREILQMYGVEASKLSYQLKINLELDQVYRDEIYF